MPSGNSFLGASNYSDNSSLYEVSSPSITYTVGWVCALQEEYESASGMLDEEFDGPEFAADRDDNTYICGRIGKHNVVIGCLPIGRPGTNGAGRVVRDMIRTFPDIRFALMVGIGGGAPTPRNDIRLGDVVVSKPGRRHGGVVQYDMVRKEQDGTFERTGQLDAPPAALLGAIPDLQRHFNDPRKPDRIAAHIKRMDHRSDYARPVQDRLHRETYIHMGGSDCSRCSEATIDRPVRNGNRVIAIHYGTIASGDTLLRDAIIRNKYAHDPELEVLCFEMEAAGILSQLPCLVVRGISDYSDTHKNDDWRKYASLTAAAYARELLLTLKAQRVKSMPTWEAALQQGLGRITRKLGRVGDGIDKVEDELAFAKLSIAKGAQFDSYSNGSEGGCLEGTRTDLCKEIANWAESPYTKPIFWLQGMAGTGKSTISRTIAKSCQEGGILGASFFFKREDAERGNATKFFSTIVSQLAANIPPLQPYVLEIVKKNPDIPSKVLVEQFQKLLVHPLMKLASDISSKSTIVIVIDALDECENEEDVDKILHLFLEMNEMKELSPLRVKIFTTSRPEAEILATFKRAPDDKYKDLVLHDIPSEIIKHDISLFIDKEFEKIRLRLPYLRDWPDQGVLEKLADRAVPLFICAVTMCRYIADKQFEPPERLDNALSRYHKVDHYPYLEDMYLTILEDQLLHRTKRDVHQILDEFQEVVGQIIILTEPLNLHALEKLLGVSRNKILHRLNLLRSVFNIPSDEDKPIGTLHGSFRDFLLSRKTYKKSDFWVDGNVTHRKVWIRCLRVMGQGRTGLRKNICQLSTYGERKHNIPRRRIDEHVSSELQYCCRFWVYHVQQGGIEFNDGERIWKFLKVHFLHWLELMSVLGEMSKSFELIEILQSKFKRHGHELVKQFLHDASRFILMNGSILYTAPLQVYCCGLLFTPGRSLIREQLGSQIGGFVSPISNVGHSWDPEIHTLKLGHAAGSLVFSLDGKLLATRGSRSWNDAKQWDVTTGALQQNFGRHMGDLAFLPSGRLIGLDDEFRLGLQLRDMESGIPKDEPKLVEINASLAALSANCELITWAIPKRGVSVRDMATGETWKIRMPRDTIEEVRQIIFSPGNTLVATVRARAVDVWDVFSGKLRRRVNENGEEALSASVSKGKLATGHDEGEIRVWSLPTKIGSREVDLDWVQGQSSVTSLAFSLDGKLLASGSSGSTVRLWDVKTQTNLYVLLGHTDQITAITFSPTSRILATGSDDGSVRLWYTIADQPAQYPQPPKDSIVPPLPHSKLIADISCSPDGAVVATCFTDGTVQLWRTTDGTPHGTIDCELYDAKTVWFSPDSKIIACVTSKTTVELWDTAEGELRHTLKGGSTSSQAPVFSSDSRFIAVKDGRADIGVWETATGIRRMYCIHSKEPTMWSFSPDCRHLVSGYRGGSVHVYDVVAGRDTPIWNSDTGKTITAAKFSPCSRLVALGSMDNTIRIWDRYAERFTKLESHTNVVRDIAFSANGKLIASCSDDGTIRLWNAKRLKLVHTLMLNRFDHGETWASYVTFNADNTLETDFALFGIEKTDTLGELALVDLLNIKDSWIWIRGKKMIWLPVKYQISSWCIWSSKLVLGHKSGAVSIMDLDISKHHSPPKDGPQNRPRSQLVYRGGRPAEWNK